MLSETGLWLGKGIATFFQIFNHELIVLGGVFAEANTIYNNTRRTLTQELLFIPIKETNRYCFI